MENFKEECWQDLNPDNFISPSSVLLFVRGAQGLLRPNSLLVAVVATVALAVVVAVVVTGY